MNAKTPSETSRPGRTIPSRGSARRWLVHTSLALGFAAVGGWMMVWPQWIAADSARNAYELQAEREKQFSERMDQAHLLVGHLRDWQQDGRRVFLRDELTHFATVVGAIARRDGATAVKVKVSGGETSRFRTLSLQAADRDGVPIPAGEIEPRSVRVVVTGKFENVYRTIATLCQQQRLFIPERWDLALSHGSGQEGLRAEVLATVFVVTEPDEKSDGAAAADAAVASGGTDGSGVTAPLEKKQSGTAGA